MKKYFLFLIFLTISNTYSQELKIDEKAFSITEVDEKPVFKDGMEKFYKYIAKNFKMPEEEGLKGKIIVEFIIETDGSISNFTVIQDIGYGTAEEVARVFKDCPKWLPGKKDGQTVRTLYRFPISIMSAS
jgi:protein TonB